MAKKTKPEVAVENLDEEIVDQINTKYGEGSLVTLGSKIGLKIPSVPTGLHPIDWDVIGSGGIPRGRITEIFGPESSGKTTLALQCIAMAQKAGEQVAYIDVEHALDPKWMGILGVDVEKMLVSQPDHGEQALSILVDLVKSGQFSLIVVDSVAALVPKAELEGEIGESHMGLHARMMSQAMRMLTAAISTSNTAVIFINQVRDKIGVVYGNPEVTTGGRALRFYASLRLDVRRIGAVKHGESIVGNQVKIKAVKNKISAPFKECVVDLLFHCGFDTVGSLVDAAVVVGVIQKSGTWFSYGTVKLGQGQIAAANKIKELNLVKELEDKVNAATTV